MNVMTVNEEKKTNSYRIPKSHSRKECQIPTTDNQLTRKQRLGQLLMKYLYV